MSKKSYTEADIDNLIASVEETLAKSVKLSKDEDQQDSPVDESQEQQAPAPEAQAPEAMQGQDDQAPQAEGQSPEQPLEQEEQGTELSDEELQEIYASMPPEEIQRHLAIIQSIAGGQAGQEQQEGQSPEQAPAPEAQAPEAEQAPQDPAQEEMGKSEGRMDVILSKMEEQQKTIELMSKALEAMAKPVRKSVANISDVEYIAKSENTQSRPLTKSEIGQEYSKLGAGSFTKSERETINNFYLHGTNQNEVENILKSKKK
jgi:hypothetical protein